MSSRQASTNPSIKQRSPIPGTLPLRLRMESHCHPLAGDARPRRCLWADSSGWNRLDRQRRRRDAERKRRVRAAGRSVADTGMVLRRPASQRTPSDRGCLVLSAGDSAWHATVDRRQRRADLQRPMLVRDRSTRRLVRSIDRLPPAVGRRVLRLWSGRHDYFGFDILVKLDSIPARAVSRWFRGLDGIRRAFHQHGIRADRGLIPWAEARAQGVGCS